MLEKNQKISGRNKFTATGSRWYWINELDGALVDNRWELLTIVIVRGTGHSVQLRPFVGFSLSPLVTITGGAYF